MRQLTSLDSQFLALETRRQTGHVASVAILDQSTTPTGTLTIVDVQALITERLPQLPPLRWRLQPVPLGLDYPYGNRIMLMSATMHTEIADPVARLLRTHESLGDMKQRHRALPASLLADANHFIPPAVFSRAARLTFGLATSNAGRPVWNLVVSNVPGPQFPLYCAGAMLVANYPVSVITHGMGLNITVTSYMGHLDFGIVADRDQMPDVASLMGWLEEELELLLDGA